MQELFAAVNDFPPESIIARKQLMANLVSLLRAPDGAVTMSVLRIMECLVKRLKWALCISTDENLLPRSGSSESPDEDRLRRNSSRGPTYPQRHDRDAGNATPLPVMHTAHLVMLSCLPLLNDVGQHAYVLPVLFELLPILRPEPGPDCNLTSCCSLRYSQYMGTLWTVILTLLGPSKHVTRPVLGILELVLALLNDLPQGKSSDVCPVPMLDFMAETALDGVVQHALPKLVESLLSLLAAARPHVNLVLKEVEVLEACAIEIRQAMHEEAAGRPVPKNAMQTIKQVHDLFSRTALMRLKVCSASFVTVFRRFAGCQIPALL